MVPRSESLNLTEKMTMAAWVKFPTPGDKGEFINKSWTTFALGKDSGDRFRLFYRSPEKKDNILVGTTQAAAGEWNHVVGVIDAPGRQVALYVNGALEKKAPFEGSSVRPAPDSPLSIGAGGGNEPDRFFGGIVDEVRIYNRALDADEVVQLYRSGLSRPLRIEGAPAGEVAMGSTGATLSLKTEEEATCRYSTTPGVAYEEMKGMFEGTGGKEHFTRVAGLKDSQTYTYYVKGQDKHGKSNPDDFIIRFSVADTQPPTVPSDIKIIATTPTRVDISWTASTDNGTLAGYRIHRDGMQVADIRSVDIAELACSDGGLQPSKAYRYTASAYDALGNESTASQPASATTAALDAKTYYVDGTNGSDENGGLSLTTAWKTIAKANATLQAGDTVYIREGTYRETVWPADSGVEGAFITYARYQDEEAVITGVELALNLDNRHYIVIDGLKLLDLGKQWVSMHDRCTHNIVRNCTMRGAGGWGGIGMSNAEYNKILNNTLTATPTMGPDDAFTCRDVRYNLFEGNYFGLGRHNAFTIHGKGTETYKNVVRNNLIWNPWHNCLAVTKGVDRLLIEGNIILDSGERQAENIHGTERDRTMRRQDHRGARLGGERIIFRRNVMINNGSFQMDSATGAPCIHNRVYNNTFNRNYAALGSSSTQRVYGNVFKNNLWLNSRHGIRAKFGAGRENHFINNNFMACEVNLRSHSDTGKPGRFMPLSWFQDGNHPKFWYGNVELDPQVADEEMRDLHLKPTSPMIDAGAPLTETTDAGSGTAMPVKDAGYFMDGWGIVEGDLIQLQGQPTRGRIVSVDYDGNTLTLDTALTWEDGQGVSLAYEGKAPDIGAYEHGLPDLQIGPRPPILPEDTHIEGD